MIHGTKVTRPSKEKLADDIAVALSLPTPYVSTGSSVDSLFLDRVYQARSGRRNPGADTYRKTEAVLDELGLTYDPYWDTSESAPTGGGTVTTRAFSRIRAAVTRSPRCFLLNVNDAPVGERWERDHTSVYRYDTTVTGRMPLNEAGPGSLVLYYATSKSRTNPMHFIAAAEVEYIAPGSIGGQWPRPTASNCTQCAIDIQQIIGGQRAVIGPAGSGRVLGPSANNPLGDWAYHEVVVKNGMVYDGFTGRAGMSINDFKAQFQYSDAINFGF